MLYFELKWNSMEIEGQGSQCCRSDFAESHFCPCIPKVILLALTLSQLPSLADFEFSPSALPSPEASREEGAARGPCWEEVLAVTKALPLLCQSREPRAVSHHVTGSRRGWGNENTLPGYI